MDSKVVIGCPGSGKSTYLARTASSLPEDDTLVLTYSRSAAISILKKINTKCKASTIHALCFRDLGIQPQQIMQGEQIVEFCHHLKIDPPADDYETYDPSVHPWEIYSYARTTGSDPIDTYFTYPGIIEFDFPSYVKFVKSLETYKKAMGIFEFHDLLDNYEPKSAPKNLLVDEAQDNSFTLTRAIEKLVQKGVENLWMVGDPNQSIYTYSGADPKYLHHFGGVEEFLEQSYRCPASIVNKAKSIFPDARFNPTNNDGIVVSDAFIPDDVDMILVRTNYIRHKILKKIKIDHRKVLTMHKAKGLQADHVVIINSTTRKVRMSEEIDPLSERRLLYTAVSRAKVKLTIIEGKNPNVIL